MVTQYWDDEQRRAERQRALIDPNPHLRRGGDPRLQAALAPEIEAIQRSEILGTPTNFLPPEERRRGWFPGGTRH
jgi:hypothetical protein